MPGSVRWRSACLGLTQEVGRTRGRGSENLLPKFCISEIASLPLTTRRFLGNVSFVIRESPPKYLQTSRMRWLPKRVASV